MTHDQLRDAIEKVLEGFDSKIFIWGVAVLDIDQGEVSPSKPYTKALRDLEDYLEDTKGGGF